MLPGPAVPGCCWISLHFLWGKLSTHTVFWLFSWFRCLSAYESAEQEPNYVPKCQLWTCQDIKMKFQADFQAKTQAKKFILNCHPGLPPPAQVVGRARRAPVGRVPVERASRAPEATWGRTGCFKSCARLVEQSLHCDFYRVTIPVSNQLLTWNYVKLVY